MQLTRKKNGFFNGNIQSYRYLLTEVFIQVAIAIKVAILYRSTIFQERQRVIPIYPQTLEFEKYKGEYRTQFPLLLGWVLTTGILGKLKDEH